MCSHSSHSPGDDRSQALTNDMHGSRRPQDLHHEVCYELAELVGIPLVLAASVIVVNGAGAEGGQVEGQHMIL